MFNADCQGRFFLYQGATDMRKGIWSLCGLVREGLKLDPESGDMFLFMSRDGTRLRVLRWEGDGFALYTKLLCTGRFEVPKNDAGLVERNDVRLLLMGIRQGSVRYLKRYSMAK
jgi:transposase